MWVELLNDRINTQMEKSKKKKKEKKHALNREPSNMKISETDDSEFSELLPSIVELIYEDKESVESIFSHRLKNLDYNLFQKGIYPGEF